MSEFEDNDDDAENGSDNGSPSMPMHAFLIDDDSLDEYESDDTEDALTEQTHSSWIKEMIPDSADLEAGTRHSLCEFDDGRDDYEKDSHDGLPSMPIHDASVDDDSSEGYESENTDDELAHQTASITALVDQTSQ